MQRHIEAMWLKGTVSYKTERGIQWDGVMQKEGVPQKICLE
jgi:hypothetical protein